MIKVLFFASYREKLGLSEYIVEANARALTLAALKLQLIAENNDQWREVLEDKNLVQAVNQAIVRDDWEVNSGDEVAFFPPVTGG